MDASENLLRAVRFEKPDTVPMTFHINAACWHHYPHEALRELMAGHPILFPDYDATKPTTPVYSPNAIVGQPFTDPWGCVWETTDNGIVGIVVEHPLATWDRFDEYVPPDPDKTTHWLPIDWAKAGREPGPSLSAKGLPNGEIGHNHTWLRLMDIRGYQNALIDMLNEEPRLMRLLEMLEEFNAGLVRNYLQRAGARWMGFSEDLGMQSGPMLSPDLFRRFIQPSYQRMMRPARDAGAVVHVHSDGQVHALIDDLLACPIDVLNIQDLVNGVDWIAGRLAGRICIELDIDRQKITPHATPAVIDALILEEIQTLGRREGGLMMIYGLYPGVPLENAKAVMDAMEKYAAYWTP